MDGRFEKLAGAVAAKVLLDAVRTSQKLSELGVPHALIGGLAVGVHGHPRATRDADSLVGSEAFDSTSPLLVYRDELSDLVQLGSSICWRYHQTSPGFPRSSYRRLRERFRSSR